MKIPKKLYAIAILAVLATASMAVPHQIDYQGKLTDATGVGYNDTLDMSFRIFTAPTGGAALWTENHHAPGNDVPIVKGLFDVALGSITPINLDFDVDYWLEITVDGNILLPRVKLNSSPYAYRAAIADSVVGGSAAGDTALWEVHATDPLIYSKNNENVQIYDDGEKYNIYAKNNLTSGNGNAVIWAYRGGDNPDATTWDNSDMNAAIKAESYFSNSYSAAIAGFYWGDYDSSAAVVGSYGTGGDEFGALGFYDGTNFIGVYGTEGAFGDYAAWFDGPFHLEPQPAPVGPVFGDIYADDTANKAYFYDGSSWVDMTATPGTGSSQWTDHATDPYIYANNNPEVQVWDNGEDTTIFVWNDNYRGTALKAEGGWGMDSRAYLATGISLPAHPEGWSGAGVFAQSDDNTDAIYGYTPNQGTGVFGVAGSPLFGGVRAYNTNSLTQSWLATGDYAGEFDGGLYLIPGTAPLSQAGAIYANSTDNNLYYYDGTSWVDLTAGGGGADSDWQVNGDGTAPDTVYNLDDFIGIGTDSPTHKLTVSNSDDDNTLRLIGHLGGGLGYGARLNFGDGDYAYIEESADDDLKLHATDIILEIDGNVGSVGQVLTSDGTSAHWEDAVGGADGDWNIGTGLIYNITDNVAIGTTVSSMNVKLTVQDGNIKLLSSNDFIDIDDSGTAASGIRFYRSGSFQGALFTLPELAFISGGFSERTLAVDLANERVGIGTGSPTVKFDVEGDARVNGDLEVTGTIDPIAVVYEPQTTTPTAVEGKLYYNDTANELRVYNGTSWQSLGGSGGSGLWTDHTTYISPNNNANFYLRDAGQTRDLEIDISSNTKWYGIFVDNTSSVSNYNTYTEGNCQANIGASVDNAGNHQCAIVGWSDLDTDSSASVLGANIGGTVWGALGYKYSGSEYAGYFNGDVNIDGNLTVTGTFPGDNLGNHTATTDLDMSNNDILDVGYLVSGSSVSSYPRFWFGPLWLELETNTSYPFFHISNGTYDSYYMVDADFTHLIHENSHDSTQYFLRGNAAGDVWVRNELYVGLNASVEETLFLGSAEYIFDAGGYELGVNADWEPETDDFYNLGNSDMEWNDLYVDGIAHLDAIELGGVTETSWPDATPGGVDGNVQYNNSGVLDGSADLVWDDTNNRLGVQTTTPTHLVHIGADRSTNDVLRLEGTGGFGSEAKLNFGDGDIVYISEYQDDDLKIYAPDLVLETNYTTGEDGEVLTSNGTEAEWQEMNATYITLTAGEALVKGNVVSVSTTADMTVVKSPIGDEGVIGVVLAGAASGSDVKVAISGAAEVLVSETVTRGNFAEVQGSAGEAGDDGSSGEPGNFGIFLEGGTAGDLVWVVFKKAEIY